jgi:SRSO17 transposase
MERRFTLRYRELMDEAMVRPESFEGILQRLDSFVKPFTNSLIRREQRRHAWEYVAGLLSNLRRKNTEMIAYLHEQDRQPLQKFIGQTNWDHEPLIGELARQIGDALGETDGVLVIDPSGFPKQGRNSVGVDRQWCGRLGKVENCQVGIYMGYVSRNERALVDFRLYLSKAWCVDKKRKKDCGVPKGTKFRTRHEMALEMIEEHGANLPHAWITGDDEMGKSSIFRKELREMNERYLLAVPGNTLVRDLDATLPPCDGRGRPRKSPFQRMENLAKAFPEKAWTTIGVRDGEKGPLEVQMIKARVQTKQGIHVGPEEIAVAFRERQRDGSFKHDYGLTNAPADTPLAEFARVFKAEHRIEECLKRAKSEAGLADYEVRTWEGWHHHQTLSLLASWFLTREKQRGEKNISEPHRSPSPPRTCTVAA